jgi:hypothetical protein
MFFSLDTPPDNPIFAVLWPLVLVILSITIWYLGYRAEQNGRKIQWKWLAMLPLFLSLLIGISALRMVISPSWDSISDAYGIGRKITYAVYAAAALPVIGIIVIVGNVIFQRVNSAQRF